MAWWLATSSSSSVAISYIATWVLWCSAYAFSYVHAPPGLVRAPASLCDLIIAPARSRRARRDGVSRLLL
ncbi:hypothetical protein JVT61DRAFT_8075 [Boletus reticuloceps]|uniref:Uncharacterized protein n=1 Tax=Boletus reticuloceps TaxID=495285 RepID=A0A8I3A5T8_9AGAM|nr:hypothetical protein JVT61DRAFT_15011 [Boletus reticuloceps]KAG6372271.1 hypothetical protein JVT61DRAFT_8075 [Boletus reticuloceps]